MTAVSPASLPSSPSHVGAAAQRRTRELASGGETPSPGLQLKPEYPPIGPRPGAQPLFQPLFLRWLGWGVPGGAQAGLRPSGSLCEWGEQGEAHQAASGLGTGQSA